MAPESGYIIPADETGQYLTSEHQGWRLTDFEKFMLVESPLLGAYVVGNPGDELMRDIFSSPLGRRSLAVSQLSGERLIKTIPNTADMYRAAHVMDSVEIARRLARKMGASDEQALAAMLYQLDDLAHGGLSHVTDMTFDKLGGSEDFHESHMSIAVAYGGLAKVFAKHGIRSDDRGTLPDIALPPWVETPAPDLCVDRFQYTTEELRLWFAGHNENENIAVLQDLIQDSAQLDSITITDEGHMAFKDIELARIFAKGYLLLSTEHWNEPANRVQIHLLSKVIKHAIAHRRYGFMDELDNGHTHHPESYYFAIDRDITQAMQTGPLDNDSMMYSTRGLLRSIGSQERERFVDFKLKEYVRFLLDEQATEYPSNILNPHLVDYGMPSTVVGIEVNGYPHESDKQPTQMTIDDSTGYKHFVGTLKNRYIDPQVVMADGSTRRLSEIDRNFATLLDQQQRLQALDLHVRLALAPNFESDWVLALKNDEHIFDQLKNEPRISPDQWRRSIEQAAQRATEVAVRAGHLVLRAA